MATKGQQQPRGQPTYLPKNDTDDTIPDKAFHPTVSCLCHRRRKSIQHIRTLKLLWESMVSDELPIDQHTATIFHHWTRNNKLPFLKPPQHSKNITSNQPSQPPLQSADATRQQHCTCLQSVIFRSTAVKI